MPGSRDIIKVADAVVTQLKNSLPTKLNTLDTEYDDGIVLRDIPPTHYFISEQLKPPGFPLVQVTPDRTDMNPFNGENRYNIEYQHLKVAIALSENVSEDILTRKLGRTLRGAEEVFLENRTLSASVDDVIVMAKEYTPMFTNRNALMRGALIRLRVMTRP